MTDFMKLVEKDLQALELSIDKLLTTRIGFIREIVDYIINSGGKRVRPVLVMLSAKLCGYRGNRHIPFAAIIEFIHTATLLHDDVVDNARTRRGASTVNSVWGNEPSVLVGDFLYSRSFELMSKEGNHEIMKVISAATTALSEGEILEIIHTSNINTTESDYYEIIGNKTAVLFSAACEIGAILGDVPGPQRKALRNFGFNLGIAFQLRDDILDYTSYDSVLGKKVGTDLKEGKLTLPFIRTLKLATENEKTLAEEIIHKNSISQKDFEKIRKLIDKHKGMDYAAAATEKYLGNARKYLDQFPASKYKDALLSLSDYMLKREK
ncbi:MAG TPA: polyprenyl synthetase family protein [Syntrophorhabdaceae bacterium]|nr:polyprenyl synthetase family protein [Syntrophorhabdaceae bacterium]